MSERKHRVFDGAKSQLENVGRWIRRFGKEAARELRALKDWALDNPEAAAAVIVPLGIAGIRSSQSLIVSRRQRVAQRRADSRYYDPSTGMHWDLRRRATNNDRKIISIRRAKGDSTYEILSDLRLI